MEQVILVNEFDQELGAMEKLQAHQKAVMHRAFSIFIFNDNDEMLLQQRAPSKYHSGGLWTNACCSHPRPGEQVEIAACRRLKEELGFETPLTKIFEFTYKASFENGLTEHEFDHVFIGRFKGLLLPNTDEVSDVCFKPMQDIAAALLTHPHQYTAWFPIAFFKVMDWFKNERNAARA